MVLRPEKIPCRKAHKDLILLKLMGWRVLNLSVHPNGKKRRMIQPQRHRTGRFWGKQQLSINIQSLCFGVMVLWPFSRQEPRTADKEGRRQLSVHP